jgi:hypothetical protein
MSGWRRWLRATAIERALGLALGYPACCTDAFLQQRKLPNDTIRFHLLARTGERAAAPLNDVDETRAVVSHFVCRYDCAPSLRYAEALLTELGRLDPAAGAARRAALRGLVVRFREGGALRLALRDPCEGRLQIAAVHAFGRGPLVGTWQAVLREGGALEVGDGEVRVFHGDRETQRLSAPAREIALRVFA